VGSRGALSPEILKAIRRQLGAARVLDVTRLLFVAQKSQIEILIVFTETASRVPNCAAAEGTLSSAYPKLGPAEAGPFLRERLMAAATCPALGGGRGFGERAQHCANLTIARES